MLKIIADAQIPQVQQAFHGLGEVHLYNGREIRPDLLTDADALLVRTVTRVEKELLRQSRVRFVATATSGTDHIDRDYLQQQGIDFISAHGCNARAVAEYVLSALFVLADQYRFDLFSRRVGIVGCGMVGGCLLQMLRAIGIDCIVNDPPLAELTSDPGYRPLHEVLAADVISLHVPLNKTGPHATRQLINTETLAMLKDDAILLNTARGGVVDEAALLDVLSRQARPVVLDVWQGEPHICKPLLERVDIGTPHIAGYSLDGRLRATAMLHEEFCRRYGVNNDWTYAGDWQNLGRRELTFHASQADADIITMAVLSHYDVRSDAASLRRLPEIDENTRGDFFDQLRSNYPVRREFIATSVTLPVGRGELAEQLRTLGFTVTGSPV